MQKRPEITEATRQVIIDSFCLVSKEKPIEKITVQEIMRKSGYNRCTFYQYFKDVYDILEYIENIVLSQIKDNFKHNISQENFSQSFFEAFTRIHQEQAPYFDLLLKPANRTHFAEKLMTDVLPIFAERFRLPGNHPYSHYLADMYFATVVTAISHWLQQNRSLPLEELSQLLGDVLTNGVVTVMASCKDN